MGGVLGALGSLTDSNGLTTDPSVSTLVATNPSTMVVVAPVTAKVTNEANCSKDSVVEKVGSVKKVE